MDTESTSKHLPERWILIETEHLLNEIYLSLFHVKQTKHWLSTNLIKRDRDIVVQEKEHSRRKNLQTKKALSTSTTTGEEWVANNTDPIWENLSGSLWEKINRGHHCREKHGRRRSVAFEFGLKMVADWIVVSRRMWLLGAMGQHWARLHERGLAPTRWWRDDNNQ